MFGEQLSVFGEYFPVLSEQLSVFGEYFPVFGKQCSVFGEYFPVFGEDLVLVNIVLCLVNFYLFSVKILCVW